MPLGDSITQGANTTYHGYREDLWHLLEDAGYNVDFVGTMTGHYSSDDVNPGYDHHHEGHSGWQADHILNGRDGTGAGKLSDWLQSYTPDVVLLLIGTNDLNREGGSDNTVVNRTRTELGLIIDQLRADNPNVTVLLAQLTAADEETEPIRFRRIPLLNQQIEELATEKDLPGSPVIVVDQFTGFDPDVHTYDGLHPNVAGAQRMAQRWFDALQTVIEPGTPTNDPPIARASADITSGPTPLAVQFTGSASSDPDGDPLTYRWDFGDGASSVAPDPSHTYNAPGTFIATLTVRDPSGLSASQALEIRAGGGLSPVGQCVWANGDGTYTALFGYTNGTGSSRKIGIGSANNFSPSPTNRGQPTTFTKGAVGSAVAVVFDGSPLTWNLTFGGVTQRATLSSSSTPCNTDPVEPLVPIMHGITSNGNGTYNAHFGYTNPNAFKVYVPVGPQNTFAPGTANRKQPRVFNQGTKRAILVVTWNGSPLTWALTGNAAEASASSPVLPAITPALACVARNSDGTYTARFGYENPSAFTVYLKKGAPANRFVPDPKSRTQPAKFATGTKATAFSVKWNGSPLTWQLNGLSAAASSSSDACTAAALASMTAAEAQGALAGSLALADSLDAEGDTLVVWEDPELEGAGDAAPLVEGPVPAEALALAAYPNPFASVAMVEFGLPEKGEVRLEAYDVLGRLVAVLAEGPHVAGVHRVAFEAGSLPSGTYFLRLATPRGVLTSRVTLVR